MLPLDSKQCSSVQFSSVAQLCPTLQPHESQHTRPPCPSPAPRVHPNSCPLSWWCHPAISSSVIPFSSCSQSFPASESFPMNQLFAWGGQSTGVSALASVLPKNTQDWSPLEWTGWISLQSKGLSRVVLQHHSSKASILWHSAFFTVQLSHPYMTPGKTRALTRQTFVGKVMSLLLNMLCTFVINISIHSHIWAMEISVHLYLLCYTVSVMLKKILTDWLNYLSESLNHCFLTVPYYFLWLWGTMVHEWHNKI